MKLKTFPSPHINHRETARGIMGDMILAMFVVYSMTFYYYGARVALLLGVSVFSALAADMLCSIIAKKKINFRDFSAIVTGMIVPLLLPASIPLRVIPVACVFAVAIAKHPFGGAGHNVFNPAAAGIAFVTLCFSSSVFMYPVPLETLPVWNLDGVALVNSPAFTMSLGGVPKLDFIEMSLGNYPGPMGATNILVILACLLYLILRGTVRWQMPVVFFLTFSAMCFIFARPEMTRIQTVMFELMSGTVLFGGVFMISDPVTSPHRRWSKAVYAFFAAILLFIFRRYSRLEEEFVFVLLLMNASVWGFDLLGERVASYLRGNKLGIPGNKQMQKKA